LTGQKKYTNRERSMIRDKSEQPSGAKYEKRFLLRA